MNKKTIINIILFGTIWGLVEATVGGALHLLRIPLTGTIMSSIGFALLFCALQSGVKSKHIAVIASLAALLKFSDIFIFGLPISEITIINPATAILSQGLMFAVFFKSPFTHFEIRSILPKFVFASVSALAIFNIVSVSVYGWPTEHTLRPVTTALLHLPIQIIASTLLSYASFLIIRATTNRQIQLGIPFKAALASVFLAITFVTKKWF